MVVVKGLGWAVHMKINASQCSSPLTKLYVGPLGSYFNSFSQKYQKTSMSM